MKVGNVVCIGKKTVVDRVLACPICLDQSGRDDRAPKGRGMAMSNALDAPTRPTFQD